MLKLKFMNPMLSPNGGEGGGEPGGGESGGTGGTPEFDYEKLASLVAGKQTVAEDTVLKNFFKEQGLSKDEVGEAIKVFKEQKAAKTPNIEEIQKRADESNRLVLETQMENKAYLMASELGVDMKMIPYLMKLAEKSEVIVEGKVDEAKLKETFEKVLKDVPQLKGASSNNGGGAGFKQIGGAGGNGGEGAELEDTLSSIFGNKK